MIANYHTHTWRCMHADGTEKEYVENAIEGGLQILGFSDHTPMPYEGDYVSNVKMRVDQLGGYVDTVLALREAYKDQIDIRLGLEVEYYPKYFDQLLEIVRQYPIEYFLLGQHNLGNEIGDVFCGAPTKDEMSLARYCEQSLKAMETGCFTYFAHPDFIHFIGEDAIYRKHMRTLCLGAKELGVPLEINFLGITEHRHYPNESFWEIVGETGNQVIFGADAHRPDRVSNPQARKIAEGLAKKYKLNVIDTVELRKP